MKGKKNEKKVPACHAGKNVNNDKKEWKKPTLEDVSRRVMAQPYIRFT